MCGFAGLVAPRGETFRAGLLARMAARLAHRGPDDRAYVVVPPAGAPRVVAEVDPDEPLRAGIAHLRLAILDLSSAGRQPMASHGGARFLAFNGEIYNYLELREELAAADGRAFRSGTDTEVLLAALERWGLAALPRCVGMFTLADLDVAGRRLRLARDPFGIKPLYLARGGHGLAFASEIKALLEVPGLPRRAAPGPLYDYLRFGLTDHREETLFEGVAHLPAAHALEVALDDPADARATRYWAIDPERRLELGRAEAAGRLREIFLDNIRLHLRSDVPLGAALSGGVDSSAIVCAMRAVGGRDLELHAVSYLAADPAIREERWVRTAAEGCGAVVHPVEAAGEDLRADLAALIETQDEPFGSTSIYAQYCVFRAARRAGLTVMLDGQGADELLAGYRPYLSVRLANLVAAGRVGEAGAFLRALAALPGLSVREAVRIAAYHLVPAGLHEPLRRAAGKELAPAWLDGDFFRERGVALRSPLPRGTGPDGLRHVLRTALAATDLPRLLRYEDRNSMAFSIESRVPFLTPALVEFVSALPPELLIAPDGTTKSVFRDAMRGIVPDAILDRKDKIGFATPERDWLLAERAFVEDTLASETARRIAPLREDALLAEWRKVAAGEVPLGGHVWRALNLVRWAERFGVAVA